MRMKISSLVIKLFSQEHKQLYPTYNSTIF
ncbi:hypothetical protein Pint_19830 [Pistacia integerrima]|uniref:Uncharacterized protein n=1 Tax=Pistacia integerrima TaxID=434235 RepID=A0ACC0XA02_9ROSI|nr:hypothetical protein Pint_19830 [Pistacia integerrima]